MKKNNTVGQSSRQSRKGRKICHRSITIGMDLGGKTSRCCGIDESGEVLAYSAQKKLAGLEIAGKGDGYAARACCC